MAYPFYADLCGPAFRSRVAQALAQHLLFVETHLSVARHTNTHLVGEATALIAGGLFLHCRYSALRFERRDFKRAAGGAAEEVLWLAGEQGIAAYEKISAYATDHTSNAYAEAGYFVMRSGWQPWDATLVFDCGPLGAASAAHG